MLSTSFTVIVPVTHSLRELRACLQSLDCLRYPKDRFQVALVDCHVVDGLEQFCRDNLPGFNLSAHCLVLPESASQHPRWLVESRTNEARNRAMREFPAECFVFTEDDCTFESDWLSKIVDALDDETGAVGGPDLLPEGMGWFANALDFVLNSCIGAGGMRRGDGRRAKEYYPRKQNMAIPARTVSRVGVFPEDKPVSGEIDIVTRAREQGLRVVFLSDNPVWHRRVTSLVNFFRLSAYMATENVRLLRSKRLFHHSIYFIVHVSTIVMVLLLLSAFSSTIALTAFLGLGACYLLALFASAILASMQFKSMATGFGVLLLMPTHHLSLMFGTTKGALSSAR